MYSKGLLIINEFKQDLIDNTFPQYTKLDKNLQQMIIEYACTTKADILNMRLICKQMHDTILTKIDYKRWTSDVWNTEFHFRTERKPRKKSPKHHRVFLCKLLDHALIPFEQFKKYFERNGYKNDILWFSIMNRLLKYDEIHNHHFHFINKSTKEHLKILDNHYDELYPLVTHMLMQSSCMCLLVGKYLCLYSSDIKRWLASNILTITHWKRIVRHANKDFIFLVLDVYYMCDREYYNKLINCF